MIIWRSIKDVGMPTDRNKDYLVTNGKEFSVSGLACNMRFKDGCPPEITKSWWTGDENVWEDNSCCSGERIFDMTPTHWCPTDELNLP